MRMTLCKGGRVKSNLRLARSFTDCQEAAPAPILPGHHDRAPSLPRPDRPRIFPPGGDRRAGRTFYAQIESAGNCPQVMTPSPQKKKLLIFWSSTDFVEIYQSGFADHPDYDIE